MRRNRPATRNPRLRAACTRLLRPVIVLLAMLGALVVIVTVTPVVQWPGTALAGGWTDCRGDILVVLGGGLLADDILNYSSVLRSEYAIRAYRTSPYRAIVFSGSGVAERMADFVVGHGVPRAVIVTEAAATSTRENALFVQRMENLTGSKVLMTSDYHMFRAHRVFKKAGMDVRPCPIPDVVKRGARWRGRWPAFLELVEETAKIAYYFIRGWI